MEEVTSEPAEPRKPPHARAWIRRLVTWLVAFAALVFVVWMVPLRDRCAASGVCQDGLLTTLRRTNVPLLVALFGLYLGSTVAWSARWRALLGLADVHVSLRAVWRITLEAQAGGVLLPGGVAGDALRIAYVRGQAPGAPLSKVLASIFADRVVGLVTLAALATVAGFGFGGGRVGPSLPVLAAVPVFASIGWLVLRQPAVRGSRFLHAPGLRARVFGPVLEYAGAEQGSRAMVRGVLLSLVVSALQLLVIRGLVAALGASPDNEAWVYVGTTFAMIVGALPLAPGAWGTADAAFVFFLGQAGITPSVGAAVCLLYRVFWYATALIGAGSSLAHRDRAH